MLPGASIPLPAGAFERSPALKAFEGSTLIFGIRPEDLYDSKLESGSRFPTIPAEVRTIEELGSELIVHVNIDGVRIDSGDPDAVEDLGGAANAVAKFEAASAVRAGEAIDLGDRRGQAALLRSGDAARDHSRRTGLEFVCTEPY